MAGRYDYRPFPLFCKFGKFRQGMLPFIAESTGPKLFETNSGPLNSASTVVSEINKINVNSEAGLKQAENAWEQYVKLVKHHLGGSVHALHGPSANPDACLYLGMLGWSSLEVRYIELEDIPRC